MTKRTTQSPIDRGAGDQSVAWTAPTLLNSWADKASAQTTEYSRSSDGIVRLRGTIDTGTKAAGTDIFVLPVGFRPPVKTTFVVPQVVDATSVSAGAIDIQADGTVEVGGTALTASVYISLDGISFQAGL